MVTCIRKNTKTHMRSTTTAKSVLILQDGENEAEGNSVGEGGVHGTVTVSGSRG